MARIRRSVSWAAHLFAVLISFLFSVIHLAPPAWAKGATDLPSGGFSGPALTALIGELRESGHFDRCLGEEIRRLEAGTRDLAKGGAGGKQLSPDDELAPLPDELPDAQPNPQAQQQPDGAAQPRQAIINPCIGEQPRQAAIVPCVGEQPPQAVLLDPTGAPNGAAQPQQAFDWTDLTPDGTAQPQQAYITPDDWSPGNTAQPQQAIVIDTPGSAGRTAQPTRSNRKR